MLFILRRHDLEKADRLETAVSADDLTPVAEDLQTFVGQLRFVGVGVVHAHESARFAAGAGAQVGALDQGDVLHSGLGQVVGDAAPVDSTADDDDVGCCHLISPGFS